MPKCNKKDSMVPLSPRENFSSFFFFKPFKSQTCRHVDWAAVFSKEADKPTVKFPAKHDTWDKFSWVVNLIE